MRRARSAGSPEKRFPHQGNNDDAVERDDISVRQGVCGGGKVTEERIERVGKAPQDAMVAAGGFEITG